MATRLTALALLFGGVGTVSAQEMVENPQYQNWLKFKMGTSVTVKSITQIGETTTEVTVASALVEVRDGRIFVETTTTFKVGGKEVKRDVRKGEIPKTVALPEGLKKEEFALGKPLGTTDQGTETLKVAGTEVKTRWYKYQTDVKKIKADSKIWLSDEIPGRTVKLEVNSTGAVTASSRSEAIEVKQP
jgi:hypothetical protein